MTTRAVQEAAARGEGWAIQAYRDEFPGEGWRSDWDWQRIAESDAWSILEGEAPAVEEVDDPFDHLDGCFYAAGYWVFGAMFVMGVLFVIAMILNGWHDCATYGIC